MRITKLIDLQRQQPNLYKEVIEALNRNRYTPKKRRVNVKKLDFLNKKIHLKLF